MQPDKWLQLHIVKLGNVPLCFMFYVPNIMHARQFYIAQGLTSTVPSPDMNTAISHSLIKTYCTSVWLQPEAVLLFTPV